MSSTGTTPASAEREQQLETPWAHPETLGLHVPKRPTHQRIPTSQRLPPPSLFQGPPSRNDSHISIATPPNATTSTTPATPSPRKSRIPPAASFSGVSGRPTASAQHESDRADALWVEMQNTLAEVELSAMHSSHVFGTSHAKALEDLRTSQLALAQAWAKSEKDEMGDEDDFVDADDGFGMLQDASANSGKRKEKEKDPKYKNIDEETERDILLARKRREANDRYFQQVNSGVLDVVNKLEEVATAMRKVEKESREVWDEHDTTSGSDTEVTDGTEATGPTTSPG